MSELLALLDNREVGTVRRSRGRLGFAYSASWREAPGAYPLSLSMPLAAVEHPHAAIEAFLWGLLPDNELVLQRWAQRFRISPRNVFALIAEVGEDCAGAVQFVRPEHREELLATTEPKIDWLTEPDVAARLRVLGVDASAGRAPHDTGQFSLAGAQPKTALFFDGQRWGVPSGRMPTTHILKPQSGEFDGHTENEYLCLALAHGLGLPIPHLEVRRFEDVTALVIERYDRVDTAALARAQAALAGAKAAEAAMNAASRETDSPALAVDAVGEAMQAPADAQALIQFAKSTPVHRVHQEDFCQALAVHPARNYQNDGGPGPKQIVELLRAHASSVRSRGSREPPDRDEDVATFLDALVLNWLIGGTDAHAKNYSILIGGNGLVRLAPLYDIASILAYPRIDPLRTKMAMKIGDTYELQAIGPRQWRALAAEIRVDAEQLIERVRAIAAELPDRLADEVRRLAVTGVAHRVIDTLAVELPRRAAPIAAW